MGFIKNFLGTIFNPRIPKIPQPTVSARDLVGSTSSQDPDSPLMGGNVNPRKRRGIESLLVPTENLYKGGR